MSVPTSCSVDDVMCALAVQHLPGAPALCLPDEPAFGDALDVVRMAERQRLLGPLQEAVVSGTLELPQAASEYTVERQLAAMLWCLQLEVRLLELSDWFADAGGIEHLVIKGPAVAHLDETDPALRSFADLDLLVAADDLDRAVAVLESHGAKRPWPERRPGYDRRFAKSVTMTCPDGVEVDLHRTLCDGVHGARIPLQTLFSDPDTFELGGERVGALARPHRVVHAAYHAVLGSRTPRLSSLRDIAGYLSSDDLGPEVVVPIAQRWRGTEVLAVAVDETFSTLEFSPPAWLEWLDDVSLDPAELKLIERQRMEGSSYGRAKLDLWRELPGARSKLAYGYAVLWPSAAHLAGRRQGRTGQAAALLRRRPRA